jgi:hypothetical protein
MSRLIHNDPETSIHKLSLVNSSIIVKHLELVAVGASIKDKVICPDLVWGGGHKWLAVLAALAFIGLLGRHLQPRFCSGPRRPIPPQHDAVAKQKDPHPSRPISRVLRRVITHGFYNWLVFERHLLWHTNPDPATFISLQARLWVTPRLTAYRTCSTRICTLTAFLPLSPSSTP